MTLALAVSDEDKVRPKNCLARNGGALVLVLAEVKLALGHRREGEELWKLSVISISLTLLLGMQQREREGEDLESEAVIGSAAKTTSFTLLPIIWTVQLCPRCPMGSSFS